MIDVSTVILAKLRDVATLFWEVVGTHFCSSHERGDTYWGLFDGFVKSLNLGRWFWQKPRRNWYMVMKFFLQNKT